MCSQLHRYWGKDESKPKSTLTLEALHHLAQQRALERSRKGNQGLLSCKKESSDDELNSDGGTRIGDEDKGTRDESEDNGMLRALFTFRGGMTM